MKFNRFQAFGWHLLVSAVAAVFSSALVFLLWYRWPLAVATGVTEIFILLLAVDVVIGPFITLIVFNTAKKELKRDLAIVLFLQIGALFYGLHVAFIARPVYLVFNTDRFDLVYANDLSDEKLDKVSDPQFKTVPLLFAKVIAARSPDFGKARNDILFSAVAGGDDVPQLPQYYVTYRSQKIQIQQRVIPLEKLKTFNKERAETVTALMSKYASIKDDVGYLPLKGKVKDLTVIVHRDTTEVLEVTNLNPWQ